MKKRGVKMSYDISLNDPVTGDVIELDTPHFMQGGTYAIDGTTELWLNITFNYGKFYRQDSVFGKNGIRTIYGMSGAESIPVLEKAISVLGDDTDSDYWTATEGNAKKPLFQLLSMAKMRPYGIWSGD